MKERQRGFITEVDPDAELAESEKEKKKMLRLDLACGNAKKEGFIGVDISPNTQAEIIMDLEKYPWDFKDNSVYEIYCSHYIEHTSNLIRFMEEIYRILIPKGRVIFYAPYYSSIRAMQDPTHKNFISEMTFLYFNQNWLIHNNLEHYNHKCDFDILSTKFFYNPEWNARADSAKEYARRHFINVIEDIEVILQAIKPIRVKN